MLSSFIKFGEIVKVHGMKGEFIVRSNFMSPSSYIEKCYLFGNDSYYAFPLMLSGTMPNGNMIVCNTMINKYDDALHCIGKDLYVSRELLPSVDELYACDIIHLDVYTEDGSQIGTITDVVDFGSGPMIEVQPLQEKEKLEYYLYDRYTIKMVDIKQNKIFIKLPYYV